VSECVCGGGRGGGMSGARGVCGLPLVAHTSPPDCARAGSTSARGALPDMCACWLNEYVGALTHRCRLTQPAQGGKVGVKEASQEGGKGG
jgi:hypothetical protein